MDDIPHGPFLISHDGALTPTRRPALRFAWRGRGCEAVLEDGRIALTAQAGAVPYTVDGAHARPAAFAAIGAMPDELPEGWTLRLLPDHRLRLEAASALPEVVTATALVGAMVGFALALDPYLDRLESAGLGTAKT